ncbi:hypothetical protein CO058_03535 [candidate division WWE3 bacterium CG_4_9_14_0_2_um_filter_35_11]|uniref:SpoVT-AbrB domain-containing protein n=1 Tax=candidate division WWE3 bacterium CG_4_9_14_0_2_um_filter_35_11 TaxID=1975077 RepID=A0A2M8EKY4_UNCKA|nr:MAG: hypothetical protein COV25_02260 [candidate division WWE3 bacterium CG10_big_fil_rev_8_21_14_0_10_35_32]PJC23375.1 MAG: hypothetical protein CO058_03535 [candidate division WWE3 bacterium CG_4_9_14_0_2_um_filter_35_11]
MQTVTITSKNQITIPKYIVNEINAEMGDKLIVSLKDNLIILKPTKSVMDDLYGSVSTPKHLKGKDIDEVIKASKLKRFSTPNSQ